MTLQFAVTYNGTQSMGALEQDHLDYSQELRGVTILQPDFTEDDDYSLSHHREASPAPQTQTWGRLLNLGGLLLGCALLKAVIDDQIALRSLASSVATTRAEVADQRAQIDRLQSSVDQAITDERMERQLYEALVTRGGSRHDLNQHQERPTSAPVYPNVNIDDEVMKGIEQYPGYLNRTIDTKVDYLLPQRQKTVREVATMTMDFLDKSVGMKGALTRDIPSTVIWDERAQKNE